MPRPETAAAAAAAAGQPTFSPTENAFLASQALGRLAYLDAEGVPVAVPVSFRVVPDGESSSAIAIGGHRLTESAKYRALRRDPRCSFVVDESIGSGARGLIIKGRARLIDAPSGAVILIQPSRLTSWGIDTPPYQRLHRELGPPSST